MVNRKARKTHRCLKKGVKYKNIKYPSFILTVVPVVGFAKIKEKSRMKK